VGRRRIAEGPSGSSNLGVQPAASGQSVSEWWTRSATPTDGLPLREINRRGPNDNDRAWLENPRAVRSV